MSKRVIFYNYDKDEIYKVLERVGKTRFQEAIEHLEGMRCDKMSDFRLKYRLYTCSLEYYKGDRQYASIMIVTDDEMPLKGWTMKLDGW